MASKEAIGVAPEEESKHAPSQVDSAPIVSSSEGEAQNNKTLLSPPQVEQTSQPHSTDPPSEERDDEANVEHLRRLVREKSEELGRVRALLVSSSASSVAADAATPGSAAKQQLGLNFPPAVGNSSLASPSTPEPSGSSVSDLHRQLTEATARWRREERRAKAREEELQGLYEAERARAERAEETLEKERSAAKESGDKLRDATRKRTQAQAQLQSLQTELEELKDRAARAESSLTELASRLAESETREKSLFDQLERRLAESASDKRRLEELEAAHAELSARSSDLEARAEDVERLQAELEAANDGLNKARHAARASAQLVRDLKHELKQSMGVDGSSVLSVAEDAASPQPASAATLDRVARELAQRLEKLLEENELLREKVKYLEGSIQDWHNSAALTGARRA